MCSDGSGTGLVPELRGLGTPRALPTLCLPSPSLSLGQSWGGDPHVNGGLEL